MSIEGQNFSSIENQPLNNEIQNETPDNLEQISAFFESHDFDTSYLQNSYEAFSSEQKEFLIQVYNAIQNNPDLLMEIMELPYDKDSFEMFQDTINTYLEMNWLEPIHFDTNNPNIITWERPNSSIKKWNGDIYFKWEEIKSEWEEKKAEWEEIKSEWEEIQEQQNNENITSEKLDVNTESEKQKINNVYQELLKDWEYKEFFNDNKLDKYSDIDTIKSFFAKEENVIALFKLAEEKWPQAVEKLYNDLTTLNNLPNFSVAGLEKFSIELKQLKPTPEPIIEVWLDTSQFHISRVEWDSLIYGDQKIDFGENPPVKYITNGNFELKSTKLDYKVDKQLRSDIFVLEHKIPQFDEKISSLESQKLKSMEYSVNMQNVTSFNEKTLDFLFDRTIEDKNSPLKNEIKNAIETVGRDNNSQNTEKLKSLLIENSKKKEQEINILLTELNSQKHLAELKLDMMKDKLDAMREAFKQKVLEKDEKVRNVIKFVNQIGLDLINPQSRLEQLFTELQQNSLKVPGLSLDPKKIDLANGRFGESDMEESTDKWQINLIKFFNKMISGNTDEPHNIEQFISVWGKTINPTEFKQTLEDSWIINDMWEAQIDTIRNNLKSTTNSKNSQEK